jgi:ferritin-like metal-binding protein YciE
MEHYEISGYGTAAHYAQRLGKNDVFKLLEQHSRRAENRSLY